jgi:hypothetical protein
MGMNFADRGGSQRSNVVRSAVQSDILEHLRAGTR